MKTKSTSEIIDILGRTLSEYERAYLTYYHMPPNVKIPTASSHVTTPPAQFTPSTATIPAVVPSRGIVYIPIEHHKEMIDFRVLINKLQQAPAAQIILTIYYMFELKNPNDLFRKNLQDALLKILDINTAVPNESWENIIAELKKQIDLIEKNQDEYNKQAGVEFAPIMTESKPVTIDNEKKFSYFWEIPKKTAAWSKSWITSNPTEQSPEQVAMSSPPQNTELKRNCLIS